MPKGSYKDIKSAKKNAKLVIKKTKCDAIKLESNKKNYKIIKSFSKKKNTSNGSYWIYTTI